jgi:Tol biopolymer transport system component
MVMKSCNRTDRTHRSYGSHKSYLVAFAVVAVLSAPPQLPAGPPDPSVRQLANEVQSLGWIVFSAKSDKGDWDLFLCRPDGSALENLTRTPDYGEIAPQFSRDGRRLLYRRLPRGEAVDGNQYGTQGELVLANSGGSGAKAFGKAGEYPWASWSPDGKQLACLSLKGVTFVEIATRRVVRRLERKGFFQQLTWSPDGKWLVGVANSFGTGWSVARMDAASGAVNAVSRVDCCTPDWFPDGRRVIFSNRPLGQTTNKGYGWTQLWLADADGNSRRLVYGEDGRHVYGGQISPDGKYVLFTGNVQENGDPGNSGAPMGLVRLADAPIIVGQSPALRAAHPDAKQGPVLTLPAGWEPCWTAAEIRPNVAAAIRSDGSTVEISTPAAPAESERPDAVAALAAEVRPKGWIAFSAETGQGDWDLYLMRPDGSDRRKLTDTRAHNEAGARFSPDGRKLRYFRMAKTDEMDNNTYGTYDLVIANADGSQPEVLGRDFPWATWSPDGKQLACLAKGGIQIVDLATRKVVRQLPRKGIVEQLGWSADGQWFVGTANGLGPYWNIGKLDPRTSEIVAVSQTNRYNCTPDWLPDSRRIIYSHGIIPAEGGWTELWVASDAGRATPLLYAETGRHTYGGGVSPDARYVLFTRSEADLGRVGNSKTRMALIRWSDTPMVGGDSPALRKRYPQAKSGPMLDLAWGWEPHWTYADVGAAAKPSEPDPAAKGSDQK